MASNSNGISELKENEIPFEIDGFETENVVTKPEDLIEEVQSIVDLYQPVKITDTLLMILKLIIPMKM